MKKKSAFHVAECSAFAQPTGSKPSRPLVTAVRACVFERPRETLIRRCQLRWLLAEIQAQWSELSLRQQRETAQHAEAESKVRAAKRERVRKRREERELEEQEALRREDSLQPPALDDSNEPQALPGQAEATGPLVKMATPPVGTKSLLLNKPGKCLSSYWLNSVPTFPIKQNQSMSQHYRPCRPFEVLNDRHQTLLQW